MGEVPRSSGLGWLSGSLLDLQWQQLGCENEMCVLQPGEGKSKLPVRPWLIWVVVVAHLFSVEFDWSRVVIAQKFCLARLPLSLSFGSEEQASVISHWHFQMAGFSDTLHRIYEAKRKPRNPMACNFLSPKIISWSSFSLFFSFVKFISIILVCLAVFNGRNMKRIFLILSWTGSFAFIFERYLCSLGNYLTVFSFRTLKMSFHSVLCCIVFCEKSDVILIYVLYLTCLFLADLRLTTLDLSQKAEKWLRFFKNNLFWAIWFWCYLVLFPLCFFSLRFIEFLGTIDS